MPAAQQKFARSRLLLPPPPPQFGVEGNGCYRTPLLSALLTLLFVLPQAAYSQQATPEGENQGDGPQVEEIVVTGSQIQGASAYGLLPVTVLGEGVIDATGATSGEELLDYLTEQGQNLFNEGSTLTAGVNSARGDIGSFNLRNLGTGNTLVLLNGRRMVNSATFRNEIVGGSVVGVPVNSVNSNSLPITGLRSLEVLKDGASAIYGADAVAGVVNYRMRSDFEGFQIKLRHDEYDSLPRQNLRATVAWGDDFNNGRTDIYGVLYYYSRDRVSAKHDPRWANADQSLRAPAPYDGSDEDRTRLFRFSSSNSVWGRYDILNSLTLSSTGRAIGTALINAGISDRDGEFRTYPTGDERCVFQINEQVCGAADADQSVDGVRYNVNEYRDVLSELDRTNLYMSLDHDFDSGVSGFAEFLWYNFKTNGTRSPLSSLSFLGATSGPRMDDDHYYNPLGDIRYSKTRLEGLDSLEGLSASRQQSLNGGLILGFDGYRWTQAGPREVHVTGDTYRLLGGLRGSWGDWDWEGALLWSQSKRHDITYNRISNTLLQEGLDSTANADNPEDAINPFGLTLEDSNIGQALVDVYRDNQQTLKMVDFKLSNSNLLDMAGGPVSALIGLEHRVESYWEDRDPRLDGTVRFRDNSSGGGRTFPYVSDVLGSSPSPDHRGSRDVTSVFGELLVPVLSNLDMQLALRHEKFSDVEDATVGKVALGWRPIDQLLLRGSWSEAFRAPNLITVNQGMNSRQSTVRDQVCIFVDPEEDVLDCDDSVPELQGGNPDLVPETSENYNIGAVLQPIDGLTLTADFWKIEKEDTIGLMGASNQTALDLLYLRQAGDEDCDNVARNMVVVRGDVEDLDMDERAVYVAKGICPQAPVIRVEDQYLNLDTRTVKGHDLGLNWLWDSRWGEFDFRYATSRVSEFSQLPSGAAGVLLDAQASGDLPDTVPVRGFADLLGEEGNLKRKDSMSLSWRYDNYLVDLTGLYYGEFDQVLRNNDRFPIDSMTVLNSRITWLFKGSGNPDFVRLGVRNLEDTRAPFAARPYGFYNNVHGDMGRYYYLEVRLDMESL